MGYNLGRKAEIEISENKELKGLHAELYHMTFSDKYRYRYMFANVYHGFDPEYDVKNQGMKFARCYLEFFQRLEHLLIYQPPIIGSHTHYVFISGLVTKMSINEKYHLHKPEEFYRKLYRRFCAPVV